MKKALLVVFYGILSVSLYGQGFAVSADKVNVLYEGVENPLMVVLEHCDCDKLVVSTDNGDLEKNDEKCSYTLSKAKPGFANLIVQKKENGKLERVGRLTLKVKIFPLPTTFGLAGRRNGPLSIQIFRAQIGIPAAYNGCSEAGSYPIQSFTVEILRDESLIFSRENKSGAFDEVTKQFFRDKLKPGDVVFFKNISCELAGRKRLLESFYISIKP